MYFLFVFTSNLTAQQKFKPEDMYKRNTFQNRNQGVCGENTGIPFFTKMTNFIYENI
jgi:hypothetical protein